MNKLSPVFRSALQKTLWESVHNGLATHFEAQDAVGVAVPDSSAVALNNSVALGEPGTILIDEPQTVVGRLRNRV